MEICHNKWIEHIGNGELSGAYKKHFKFSFFNCKVSTICKVKMNDIKKQMKNFILYIKLKIDYSKLKMCNINPSSVQSLSHVRLFATPWTAARQASLSITSFWSPPKPMSTESVMPSNHLILCHSLLLLPSIFPSIRVFSK